MPPDGWEFVVHAGWTPDEPEPAFVQVGKLSLPKDFTLRVRPVADPWRLWLSYGVRDGEVHLIQATSSRRDLGRCLDDLRAAWPLKNWTRHAVVEIVNQALHVQEQDELLATYKPGMDWHQHEEWTYIRRGPLRLAAIQEVDNIPIGHRRNRVTDEHLRRVAQIYTAAFEAGGNPTQAVQEHFSPGTSYSTAARWVGMARKRLPDKMPAPTRGVRKAQP